MPWVAVGLVVAGTALSLWGQKKSADAEDAATEANIMMIETKVQEHKYRAAKLKGTQQALYAKTGVEMTGSPLEVMADQAHQAELTKQNIRYQQQILKEQQDMAQSSRWMGYASTILSGATKAVGMFSGGLGAIRRVGAK